MRCEVCGQGVEYDEGEGNIEDGYTCYDCIREEKFGDLKNDRT